MPNIHLVASHIRPNFYSASMRVKKYKRVKRPSVHVELPEVVDDEQDAGGIARISVALDRPEESDNTAKGADEHPPKNVSGKTKRVRGNKPEEESYSSVHSGGSTASANGHAATTHGDHLADAGSTKASRDRAVRRSSALVWPENLPPADEAAFLRIQTKSGNQTTSEDDMPVADSMANGPAAGPSSEDNGGKSQENQTPRTTACSDVASLTPSGIDLGNTKNGTNLGDATLNLEDEEDEYEEYDEHGSGQDEDSANGNTNNARVLESGGSLCFKAERVAIFLQLLALALDVDGAAWPPLFVEMWSWTWFTTDYLRWPLLVLLRRVARGFSLTFGDDELDLWFFRDVVGYGIEICAAIVAVFVLFFVLQMPDYTGHKAKTAWRRSFLTHWFRLTVPRYLFNLCFCYGAFAALAYYGSDFFQPDVVAAVIVVGGTLLTVSWLFVVLLSFAVHLHIRVATKHDAEYSFMIAMVSWRKERESKKLADETLFSL